MTSLKEKAAGTIAVACARNRTGCARSDRGCAVPRNSMLDSSSNCPEQEFREILFEIWASNSPKFRDKFREIWADLRPLPAAAPKFREISQNLGEFLHRN